MVHRQGKVYQYSSTRPWSHREMNSSLIQALFKWDPGHSLTWLSFNVFLCHVKPLLASRALWRFSKLWKVSSTVASSESRCPVWDDSYFKQFPILWERWPNMACESVSLFWEVLHLLLIPGQYLLNCYSVRYCQAHWHFWWGDRGKV